MDHIWWASGRLKISVGHKMRSQLSHTLFHLSVATLYVQFKSLNALCISLLNWDFKNFIRRTKSSLSVATFTRSRRDQWPSFPGDGRWFQGEAGWGLVTWSPGGGREASFVCLAEYAILSGHTPHRMSGQLPPLWLPQVSWSRVSLLCCLHIMVRIQQTMPTLSSSTRYCISLTLPSLFSFVRLWSDWG